MAIRGPTLVRAICMGRCEAVFPIESADTGS
jgi:hypothetical protein